MSDTQNKSHILHSNYHHEIDPFTHYENLVVDHMPQVSDCLISSTPSAREVVLYDSDAHGTWNLRLPDYQLALEDWMNSTVPKERS